MFKVGQKVVCKNIKGFATSIPRGIKLGEIYTIMQIGTCACGQEILHLKEAPIMERWCGTKDVYTGASAGFYSYRFEPLVGSWVEELLERIKTEVESEECVPA